MKRSEVERCGTDAGFIRGVFNYCDRWCERCPFTRQCRVYSSLEERGLAGLDNEEVDVWESLRETFKSTKEGLLQAAAEHDVDLNDPELAEECSRHQRAVDEVAEQRAPLIREAKDYTMFATQILEPPDSPIDPAIAAVPAPAVVEQLPPEWMSEVKDALEVISWYHAFIYIKLTRAVGSWADEQLETDEELRRMSKDSDGSAKVALIGMDRSWLAWATLRRHFEDGEEIILGGLKRLSDLRTATETAFPEARAFIRPGFDTGELLGVSSSIRGE